MEIADVFTCSNAHLRAELKAFLQDQALAIAMAISFVDPEVVIVGGGVVEMVGYPFDELGSLVDDKLSPVLGRRQRPVRKAQLGAAAATWGAIGLMGSHLTARSAL